MTNALYFFFLLLYDIREQSRNFALYKILMKQLYQDFVLSAVGWGVDRRTKGNAHDEIFAPAAP